MKLFLVLDSKIVVWQYETEISKTMEIMFKVVNKFFPYLSLWCYINSTKQIKHISIGTQDSKQLLTQEIKSVA